MAETGWGAMLRMAVALGVSPEAFWRLSLKEWRMLTAVAGKPVPMGRAEVEALMKAWPDEAFSLPRRGGQVAKRPGGDVREGDGAVAHCPTRARPRLAVPPHKGEGERKS